MKRSSPLVIAMATLALAACAAPTAYAPAGIHSVRGGYAEHRLEADRYVVSFAGNPVTSRQQVEMGLLLRAAELTADNGYSWFTSVPATAERDPRVQSAEDDPAWRPDPVWARYAGPWQPSWHYHFRTDYMGGGVRPSAGRVNHDRDQIDRYQATAEIVMGRGPRPTGDPNAFDAADVITTLSGRMPRSTGG
ncbi:MAG: hypothetical protein K2X25_11055 [Caulobacteraceae bacterium]|nr:hypothetical protein [Caulobacteraceae bacterium]